MIDILIGIVIGIGLSRTYLFFVESLDKNIISEKRYYDFSSKAIKAYDEYAKFFSYNSDKIYLINMKYHSGYEMFGGTTPFVKIKYKKIGNGINLPF